MSIQEELDDIYVRIGEGEAITDELHKRIDDLEDALAHAAVAERQRLRELEYQAARLQQADLTMRTREMHRILAGKTLEQLEQLEKL